MPYIHATLQIWKETDREIELRVFGNSMMPLIKAGDLIYLKLTKSKNLKRGDIFAFLDNETIVVHRLIKKKNVNGIWWFCQKGDNLSGWSWILEDKVLGRVKSIQTADRTLNMFQWPWTWINPITGFMVLFYLTVYEKVQALKIYMFGNRPLPTLFSLRKRLFKVIDKMYVVTIKVIIFILRKNYDREDYS